MGAKIELISESIKEKQNGTQTNPVLYNFKIHHPILQVVRIFLTSSLCTTEYVSFRKGDTSNYYEWLKPSPLRQANPSNLDHQILVHLNSSKKANKVV